MPVLPIHLYLSSRISLTSPGLWGKCSTLLNKRGSGDVKSRRKRAKPAGKSVTLSSSTCSASGKEIWRARHGGDMCYLATVLWWGRQEDYEFEGSMGT